MNTHNTHLVVAFLFTSVMQAADIHVGPQHTITDPQTALAVAADGDRLFLEPGTYPGGMEITKGISFLPAQEGTRFTFTGTVTLGGGANGRTILLSGCRILTGLILPTPFSSRTVLRIVDGRCEGFSQTVAQPYLRLELYRDTIGPQAIQMTSGEIVGCVQLHNGASWGAIYSYGGSALPDDNFIIGNRFILTSNTAVAAFNLDRPLHFENNSVSGSSDMLSLSGGSSTMPRCTVLNNTFYNSGAIELPMSLITTIETGSSTPPTVNLLVKNNARISNQPIGPLTTANLTYFMIASNNITAGTSAINLATGEPTNGSPLINAGDPDPRYLDLDLSINDVGCYGGSNSRANFTTPMGSAVVGFMQAPRVVAQGQPVQISAVGFDR